MENDPVRSNADETKGKYSRDEPLTFRELLDEQTDANRDPFKFQRSNEPDNPEIAQANENQVQEDSARSASPNCSGKDFRSSSRFRELADRVLQADLHGREPTAEIGANSTPHSPPRWYALRRTSVDGEEFYYLICEQYNSTFSGKVTVLDFGTELVFSPPTFSREILHDALEEQRRKDFQTGRDPVKRLQSGQFDAFETAYRRLVDLRTFEAREDAEDRPSAPMGVFDRFVVDNENAQRVREEALEPTLLPRQQAVVTEVFIDSIAHGSDIPPWIWQEVTTDIPIIAKVGFEFSQEFIE